MRFHCNKQTADLPDGHSPWKTVAVTQKPSTDILQNRTWKSTASQLNPFFENKVEIRSTHERKSCFSCTHNREREIPSFIKCNITYNAGNLKNPHELTTSVFVTSRDPDSNYICKSSSDNASCNKDFYSRMYSKTLRENTSSFIPSGGEHDKEQLDDFHNSLLELSSRRGHLCLYCGKFYSRKYGLKIHLRTHTGYKPLKCKVCKRPFGDPSNLNKHVRLHADGDTPYKCKHCGKVLVRKRDLARHIKSRHPESCRWNLKILKLQNLNI